ncbi:acyltransferase [Flavobacterium zepuense]|uniref:Acyltransferase n=1 Tax=Flavobacterium zepuense TaxID=2593302 RepID=A0A552V2D8_9FLAO|nr:acyltransferase [Flavobacterium zepuense]TRW24633.1 acyltransferase [Flavobacterium zepuense]
MHNTNIKSERNISGTTSIFLDILRLFAAMSVFLLHAYAKWYPGDVVDANEPGDYAHAAVVVFFVLSGFVISFTTIQKNRGALQYAQARLSRLYSILIPGLIITAIVEVLILYISPADFAEFSRGGSFPRYLLTLGYLNEIWFFSAGPPINGPLWSLTFEFWYYVIFGLWFYRSSGWKSIVLILLVCLFVGPKILIMMPIWLAGVLSYKLPRPNISSNMSWLLILACLIISFYLIGHVSPYPSTLGSYPLFWAGQFVTDYILGIFIAIMLWLLPNGTSQVSYISPGKLKVFREIADLTFPIYVLHMPFLFLYKSVVNYQENNFSQFLQASIIVFCLCSIFGFFLNRTRHVWNSLFGSMLFKLRSILNGNSYTRKLFNL